MMIDPWKTIRSQCFGATEVNVVLTHITTPINDDWYNTECIPAISARVSYGMGIPEADKCISLNKKLIDMGHHVPLEAVQYGFFVEGISKACGAQLSRHRYQGHVSLSRRYTKQQPKFIYPLFDYIENESVARCLYTHLSAYCENSINIYNQMLEKGVKKQDARLFMPVNVSTQRHTWANARALRDFFRLRLAKDAEWEVRRIAGILLNIVYAATPSLFEDIAEEYSHEMLTM